MPDSSRHHDAFDRAASSEALERWHVPLLGLLGVALYAGARFNETRPYEAALVALGLPLVALWAGAHPLCSGHPGVRNGAMLTALLLGVCAELLLLPLFVPWWRVRGTGAEAIAMLLVGCAIAAAVLEGVGARHGMRARFGAWAGIVAVLALYLSKHTLDPHQDPFGSVMAACVVSVFLGGGLGLICGLFATKLLSSKRGQ